MDLRDPGPKEWKSDDYGDVCPAKRIDMRGHSHSGSRQSLIVMTGFVIVFPPPLFPFADKRLMS